MQITIDQQSGFCFGVVNAISIAEEELDKHGSLYCLGDIVHNNEEVKRLQQKGLVIITHEELHQLSNTRVLIRAHGEPPETYRLALKQNIQLVDASCPVVLRLQNKIRKGFETLFPEDGQIVIFGKEGHAEVNGLWGQTQGKGIVIGNERSNLDRIDYTKPIALYSQTTQDIGAYENLIQEIKDRIVQAGGLVDEQLQVYDTICRQVANRGPQLAEFAAKHQVVIFVSGKKSSNGQYLYQICKASNANTYMVSNAEEIDLQWFQAITQVGICGATSTPMWLMEQVAAHIRQHYSKPHTAS